MGMPKLTPVFLLTTAIALTLTLTQTTALMPYTRNPIWDLMLPPDIDPLRILEQAPLPLPKDSEPVALARCDWKETPREHVITVDVPGLSKEDVKVEVEEETRVARISGERRKAEVEEKEGEKWHRAERVSAKFVRQFRLPADSDLEGVKVTLENGVLRIVVPKVAEERRKGAKVISIEEEVGSGGDGSVEATTNKAEL